MGLLTSKKALVGLVLMVVGTLTFVPSALGTASVPVYALAVAALVLTAGTWLVGTSGDGRPV
ncbi:hypothetical protein [Halogeometricum borinquense]|uniref:hypothetical protein n=1 Tax=Halogeometricum borinquense TaxID=60847 RepID=UPI00342F9884